MNACWPYPRVIAHRGAGASAPENTLAAIRKAKDLGFSGVEFDVMLAADSVPVLIHDETLDRTTGRTGLVAQTRSADLAALDAGSRFGAAYAGEPVPRYADAARLCVKLGLWANVEIKPASGFEYETGSIVGAASADLWRGAAVPPLFSSFSEKALEAAAAQAPGLARGLLVEKVPDDWRERLAHLGCTSLHCNHRDLAASRARAVKAFGCALVCYTVNDPARARTLFDWGVDAIITDRADLLAPDRP